MSDVVNTSTSHPGAEAAAARSDSRPVASLLAVLCEDRFIEAPGVKVLLASLHRHAPNVPVLCYLGQPFIDRYGPSLRRIHPGAQLLPYEGPSSWACKPAVLRSALATVGDDVRVLWVDCDIAVSGPLDSLLAFPSDVIITAEESNPNPNRQVQARQRALGLAEGTPRETTISSAVAGVCRQHEPLLAEWGRLVSTDLFAQQQRLPWNQRLLPGDQEVWEAVLCSAPHRDKPVHLLRNWREMIQATYTCESERPAKNRRGDGMFIHATGALKPWRQSRLRMAQELFPYFDAARDYMDLLDEEERQHLWVRSTLACAWKSVLGGFRTYALARRGLHRLQRLRGK